MSTTTKTQVRSNKYDGKCGRCGETVFAGEGTCQRVDEGLALTRTREGLREVPVGKWLIEHNVDDCPAERQAAHEAFMAKASVEREAYLAKPVTERIAIVSKRNSYVSDKVGAVRHATSLADAKRRIAKSAEGMTLDYMTEFARESEANDLALELAEEIFGSGEVVTVAGHVDANGHSVEFILDADPRLVCWQCDKRVGYVMMRNASGERYSQMRHVDGTEGHVHESCRREGRAEYHTFCRSICPECGGIDTLTTTQHAWHDETTCTVEGCSYRVTRSIGD